MSGPAEPHETATGSPTSTINRADATRVAIASVVAAASSYLVLMISSRVLSQADNAEFLAYWALLFGIFGISTGFQPEYTRKAVGLRRQKSPVKGPLLVLTSVVIGMGIGLIVIASSPLWAGFVLGPSNLTLVTFVAIGVVGHAVQMGLTGLLAGAQKWRPYAALIAAEAIARLGIAAVSVVIWPGIQGIAFGSAISTSVWILGLLLSPQIRELVRKRSVDKLTMLLVQLAHACASTASSAILVVGFPVLLRLTTAEAEYLKAAPLLMGAALTRAPLMVPLMTYQSVAVTHFMNHRDKGPSALWPIVRILAAIGLVGALAAALVGPWLMQFLLGPSYRLDAWVFAGLTIGATLLAGLTLTGALAAALGRNAYYSAGWLVATTAAILMLLLPGTIEVRAVIALVVGPLIGITVHVFGVQTKSKSTPRFPAA